ncbi:MAG: NYN domain-containing protein [Terracidiphilus sp.]|jgi:uncharacterized LabA/DUF88 family protein
MKRHAIFVDAGYVFAQGSVSLLGKNSRRTELKLDEAEIIQQLKALAMSRSAGVGILRVYWYDGARNGPTLDHLTLANMQDVKLRLGSINSGGEQKEVDSLLITDLIDLARNQSICDATVVTGDSDVRIAVQIAQSFGVRVHLVGLEPSRASQAVLLRQEADTVHEITRADVSKFLTVSAPVLPGVLHAAPLELAGAPQAAPISTDEAGGSNSEVRKTLDQTLEEAIRRTLSTISPEDVGRLSAVFASSSQVPTEHDRRLLGTCRALLGRDLTGDERRGMRTSFRREVMRLGALES